MTGESSGKLELLKTTVWDAERYGENAFRSGLGVTLREVAPRFADAYKLAVDSTSAHAWIDERRDMPAFEREDLEKFKAMVATGGVSWEDLAPCSPCLMNPDYLKPIQRQIYYDKVVDNIVRFGVGESETFLREGRVIMSCDHFIADGHHRWLEATLTGWTLGALMFVVPAKELLARAIDASRKFGRTPNE